MRRSLLIALACLLALAGCGGDDPLSTDEYRQQARTICTDAERASDAVRPPTRATPAAIADYFKRILEVNDRTTNRFAELEPPSELEDAHEDALQANRAGVEEVRKLVDELEKGGDPTAVLQDAPERLQRFVERSRQAARRLGVPECGR
jgi:predicted small lipoprotein YifL